MGEILNFKDALERKLVEVVETGGATGGGGQVNRLMLKNNSTKVVLVMAGEVVKGGKQDRTIGQDILLGPKKTVPVETFCVERGRWSYRAGGSGKFNKTFGTRMGNLSLNAAQSMGNQGSVWREVAVSNASAGAVTSSGTLTATLEKKDVQEAVEKLRRRLAAGFKKTARRRLTGMAVAINGKVITIDIFGHPAIYARQEDMLPRSAASQAELTRRADPAAAERAKTISAEDVAHFYDEACRGRETAKKKGDLNTNTIQEAKRSYRSMSKVNPEAMDDTSWGAMGLDAAATEAPAFIHENVSGK